MQFPIIEAVDIAAAKKRSRKPPSSSGAKKRSRKAPSSSSATTTSTSTRSGTGSNDPIPLQTIFLAPYHETSVGTVQTDPVDTLLIKAPYHETSVGTVQTDPVDTLLIKAATPRKKTTVKKKLTPKRLQVAAASQATPSSPSSNTRSKKKLHLQ
ncbi:hypothetical protein SEVIR_7G300850v4 [Setaria viridis]